VAVGSGNNSQWVRVKVFDEHLTKELVGTLHVGNQVYVEGKLKLDVWTGNDGVERRGLDVVASRADLLGQIGKRKAMADAQPTQQTSPVKPGSATAAAPQNNYAAVKSGATSQVNQDTVASVGAAAAAQAPAQVDEIPF
jgi:single-stranded DNA-binding protein